KLAYAANRAALDIPQRFKAPSVQMSATLDLALCDKLDELIGQVELHLTRSAKMGDVETYHRLRTVPGIGPILALVLLYEIHQVVRFEQVGQFLSYARLVRCEHESAGKKLGWSGKKIGNAHLRWAFAEAACLFLRASERARQWKQRQGRSTGRRRCWASWRREWRGRSTTCCARRKPSTRSASGTARRAPRSRRPAPPGRVDSRGRILSPHTPSASGEGSVRRKNAWQTEGGACE